MGITFPPSGLEVKTSGSPNIEFKDCTLGIEEPDLSGLSVHPNPATNKITITTTSKLKGETQVSIFSINGRLIKSDKFQYQDRFEMDVNTVAKGIYLLRIQNCKGVETQKLVLQ